MKPDTHEFPLRIGLETAEGLRRYQIRHALETMEDAAKACLREHLSHHGCRQRCPAQGGAPFQRSSLALLLTDLSKPLDGGAS
jgi:hypothetical protein